MSSQQSRDLPDVADLSPEQQRQLLARLLKERVERSRTFAMSVGQQGLWHAYRRDPLSTAFNVFLPTRIRSALNIDALKQSIDSIAMRHSALRTTFSDAGGELTQTVAAQLTPQFEVRELIGADEQSLRSALLEEMRRPFDLEHGPLLRIIAFKRHADDWIILAATHHIIVDFWSLVLILQELRLSYPAFAKGEQPKLPKAVCNFSDYVSSQNQKLTGDRGRQLKEFWHRTLEGASPIVEFPLDFVRPAKFTGQASISPIPLDDELSKSVASFAAASRTTAFAVVHAALQVFISRYSGQTSFCIGSPFSGRTSRQFEQTVGFFINMLPLKSELDGDPSFVEVVQRTGRKLLDALEHEEYPIAHIVRDLGTARDPGRSPLFQVACTFEKAQVSQEAGRASFLFPDQHQAQDFGGLRQESFYVPHPTCHYDLEFIFEQAPGQLRGMICYCRDLFDPQSVEMMAAGFPKLLSTLIGQPDQPLSRVGWQRDPRTNSDFGQSAQTDNAALPASNSSRADVDQLLRAAARQNPLGTAVQHDGVALSYSEIYSQALQLSQEIVERVGGSVSGRIIPIIGPRGPAAFAAMWAVHLAGGAFVPVETPGSSIDLAALVRETHAGVAIELEEPNQASAQLHLDSCPVIKFKLTPDTSAESVPEPEAKPEPDALAYVVYTSGSTGQPKGVMVRHRALSNTLHWRNKHVPLQHSDRVLMLLSHQFDAGLGIAWTTLTQGASLIWADEDARRDPNLLIDQILRDGITVLPAVPSLLRILVNNPRFRDCQSLRMVWTGGEAMPPELPKQIRAVSDAEFWNFYGPTEAAIEATACCVTGHDENRPVPIGEPIDGCEVYILDANGRPVPDTVPGEIAIGGAGLADGYLNDPELTAQRFKLLQLGGRTARRVYLTGDRGRRNSQGQIEFFGRTDHQIKLRGYRIELGEIESILEAHYLVNRAAVKLMDASTPNASLLAFVDLKSMASGSDHDERVARARAAILPYLREQLPLYKLPSGLVVMDQLPMTSSGKVDRQQLPSQAPGELIEQAIVEPRDALESYLADCWCDTLGLETVSISRNFFDVGGTSLQAALLTTRLTDDLGVDVPTALLFDLADIAHLGAKLRELHPQPMLERFGEVHHQESGANADCSPSASAVHTLLAPLKPSGSRTPIFLIHPPGGIVVCYHELSQQLTGDQPLFAIRSRGLHGEETQHETMESMAADYVDAILSAQSHGPFIVGGWSLGGLIAYEISQQLLQRGETLERLILLDTTIPQGSTDLVPESEQVNVGKEYGIALTLDQLGELPAEEQLPFLWEHAKKLGVVDDHTAPEVVAKSLAELQGLFHHHVTVAKQYQLKVLPVKVDLFRPSETPFEQEISNDRGWRHLVSDVRVHFVPGHHHSMVQMPHVAELAKRISASAH